MKSSIVNVASAAIFLLAAGCSSDETQVYGEDGVDMTTLGLSSTVDSLGKALGPISASIAELNHENAVDFGLLARLEVRPNELLEFYEPAPGVLILSGAGAPDTEADQASQVAEGSDPRAVWDAASGGAAVPQALEDAIQRAEAALPLPSGEGGPSDSEDIEPASAPEEPAGHDHSDGHHDKALGQNRQAIHAGGSGFCNTTYLTWDAPGGVYNDIGFCHSTDEDHCWNHVTGNGSAYNPNAWDFRSNACANGWGPILYSLSSDEYAGGSWTVDVGTARWVQRDQIACVGNPFNDCPSVTASVTQADGDVYHYRFHANEP